MKPRQLIIVHGPPEASQDLTESCRAFGGKDIKVYMPKLHETVDATSETHIYQVRLAYLYDKVYLAQFSHFQVFIKGLTLARCTLEHARVYTNHFFELLKQPHLFPGL